MIAAGKFNTLYTMSMASTCSIEEVANAAPNTYKWFQLDRFGDQEILKSLIKRAEQNGYKAIVLTVDAQVLGTRRGQMRNKFTIAEHLE